MEANDMRFGMRSNWRSVFSVVGDFFYKQKILVTTCRMKITRIKKGFYCYKVGYIEYIYTINKNCK